MTHHHRRFDFVRLKTQVSIATVLAAYGLGAGLRRRGERLIGPCPVHGGDNPTAFRVHLDRGAWRCFTTCGGGDVVDLVCAVERCSFAQAARSLAQIAEQRGQRPTPSPGATSTQEGFRPFLRSITLDPQTPFLQVRKRIAVATAQHFEAGLAPRSRLFRDTVAVRLHDLVGRPLGYCGRRLEPTAAQRWGKWRFPRAFPKQQVVYNAHRAASDHRGSVVVTECPWGTMRLSQAGMATAVALLGTNLSVNQAAWFAQFNDVLLLLDGDPPGRRASRAIAEKLAPATPRVYVHDLPPGMDPDDLPDTDLRSLVAAYPSFSLNPCPSRL